ncbi:MAG: hypothetical protein HDS13_00110 [Bacteroides sp.]|nr:hypothetical protein [Bacteroides sp.]
MGRNEDKRLLAMCGQRDGMSWRIMVEFEGKILYKLRYLTKLLRFYIPFKIHVVPDLKKNKNISEEVQKTMEGSEILSSVSLVWGISQRQKVSYDVRAK